MARKKHGESGGESDLMDRTADDSDQALKEAGERAEFSEVDQPRSAEFRHGEDDKSDAAEEAPAVPTGTAEQRLATKQANFKRLASRRVTGVLERLAVLKNLANTNTYDWTQEQHDKIFDTICEHFDAVLTAFTEAKKAKVRDKSQLRFEV